jgi:hypothetical protein
MIIQMKTLLQVGKLQSRFLWQHVATCGNLAILAQAVLLYTAIRHRTCFTSSWLLIEVEMHLLTVERC